MALPLDNRQVTTVVTSTLEYRRPEVINGVFNSNGVFLKMYKEGRVKVQGGDIITTNVEYGSVGGGAIPKGGLFSSTVTEFMTQMRHEWRTNYAPMNWHGIDVAKNQGAAAVIKYTDAVLRNAKRALESSIGTQMHGSGGGDNMDGFGNAVSATAAYGGIARDGSAQGLAITPTVNTTGGPFSFTMVNQAMGYATFNNERPNLIVSNQTIFDKAWERTQPSERNNAGGAMRKIGWKGNVIDFNGADWIVDQHTPSGTIEFWNTDYWDFLILAGEDFRVRGPFDLQLSDGSVGQLLLRGNLVCKGPIYQSIITNVT